MAIVRALKTGNWSDTTVWSTGALPTSADDVYSNTFIVTIDVSSTVLSISNAATTGVTAGGGFIISANGVSITCTALNGIFGGTNATTVVITASPASGSTVSIIGNCIAGGNTNGTGINFTGAGTLNVTGNMTSAITTGGGAHGIVHNSASGTINLTGNVTGSSLSASSYAALHNSTGTFNITGTVTAGSVAHAVLNNSTGTLNIAGTVNASATLAAIGPGPVNQVTILTGPLVATSTAEGSAAASGVNPCVATRWFPADTALSTFTYTMRGATVSGSPASRPARVLALPQATSAAYPSASDVRIGVVFGTGGAFTGTCAVPPAASVLTGVPVDSTVGTAVTGGVSASDIRAALGMTSANLDTQLAGISAIAGGLSASEVRTALGMSNANLDNQLTNISAKLNLSILNLF